ncbi:hypothetical protein B0I26_1239 [Anoxybacillus vitaminiphilus]|uniref:Uncharacterized protein n=1 Tax=Paranoxybacillus vitaminiphilus TaxID=581036 RepID=A0A327Y2I8_9BACL|nr:hypothetical protein [Anoxybacillus vitaminiphilus]RAK15223.1 hypothetical protein B0I26_1239 [Anoxybacillus vitaminiphilus]
MSRLDVLGFTDRGERWAGVEEGLKQGRKEGFEQGMKHLVRNMVEKGMNVKEIADSY